MLAFRVTDPRPIYPFRDEDVSQETSLFRHDPLHPPVPRMPARQGPDTIGYRKQGDIDQFWKAWFEGEDLTLDDLYVHRLRAAWRITRELANARGVITKKTQTLTEVTKLTPSPWSHPFHFFASLSDDPIVDAICENRQLPMLPPDIEALHEDGRVDQNYDPGQDPALLDFLRLTEHVASRRLFMARTRKGRYGLAGLFDPDTARLAWPSAGEIMRFEHLLIERIFHVMVSAEDDGGDQEALAILRTELDLQQHEILQVVAMARAHAAEATGLDDPETYFSMEIAKLQELARKQVSREDYRGAAQTKRDVLRLLSTRTVDDGSEDYDRIVEAEMVKEKKKKKPKLLADDMIEG